MTRLEQLAEEYLQTRRALGYKLTSQGRILAGFVQYLDDVGATRITVEAALAFATEPKDAQPIWWTRRLSVVRGFANYVHAIDPATEVPPKCLLPRGIPRATPYPYTPGEIAAVMAAARALRPALHAATYETLIGLLVVSGLRVGEAIALGRNDVDLHDGLLTVRAGKFDKARLVPLHPSTIEALRSYARCRDTHWPSGRTPPAWNAASHRVAVRLGTPARRAASARGTPS